jgi:hypothetical protein
VWCCLEKNEKEKGRRAKQEKNEKEKGELK